MKAEHFLEPETREGFYISEKREKIWAVQLQILECIDKICTTNNLRYYAANGTLLGTVKYHGFIPWDDDMDIFMPRPDYEKFAEIAKKGLSSPYYYQDGLTSRDYYRPYGRVRNSDTTAVAEIDMEKSPISGIFVDIFPVDGVNPDQRAFRKQIKKFNMYYHAIMCYVYQGRKGNVIKTIIVPKLVDIFVKRNSYESLAKKAQDVLSEYPYDKAQNVFYFAHGNPVIIKRSELNGLNHVDFENRKISLPAGYDSILAQLYGEKYMDELPPIEERGTRHTIYIDPEKPYSEYYHKVSKEDLIKHMNDY